MTPAQEELFKKRAKAILEMIIWEVLIIILFGIMHSLNKNDNCDVPAANWVRDCLIFRGFFLFFYLAMIGYAAYKDQFSYAIFTMLFITQTVFMYWLIMGNIMFFDTMKKCRDGLKMTTKYMVIAGYGDMAVYIVYIFIWLCWTVVVCKRKKLPEVEA